MIDMHRFIECNYFANIQGQQVSYFVSHNLCKSLFLALLDKFKQSFLILYFNIEDPF